MKHIRLFENVQQATTVLAELQYPTLSAIRGESGISMSPGVPPVPPTPVVDPTIPFYIDVRGTVNLSATSGLQMSTDKTNWTDTVAGDLPVGKTYFRVASDQTSPLKPNWTENNNSDYDIGGNINSLCKVDFENDTNCYIFQEYFKSKTKLKSASKLILPATTLVNSCYRSMFQNCTSLTTAPELPATTSTQYCYQNMFQYCRALTTAPELPATTLANYCYQYMFNGCTSLTTAPALPATTLTTYCYSGMFSGCTALTTAPELPATTLASYCYQYMFSGCTALTTAPELPASTFASNYCYQNMFRDCISLTKAPSILPATRAGEYCYAAMFMNCTSLTKAPELPATALYTYCYGSMFNGCTSLTTAPSILPATTLANNCYFGMFQGCTSLTTAPELPAPTLTTSCYYGMFQGCTNLNYIKCLATNISASSCTNNWVDGVSSTGAFIKAESMSGWSIGTNGIPTNWGVRNSGDIILTQSLNVVTIKMTDLDEGTGYYTIDGGPHIALREGTTTVPITQTMNGQTLFVYGEFDGIAIKNPLIIKYNANAILFYIEDISGSENTVQIKKSNDSALTLTIEKSIDGMIWETMGTTSTTAITTTIPANSKLYLRCSTNTWSQSYNYNHINTTGNCNVGGNIMSLLYGSNFTGEETTFPNSSTNIFYCLFKNNTHLVNAYNLVLPATTLYDSCYSGMFSDCTSLTTAPTLPATKLYKSCYSGMFNGCKSLTTAPELPATTLTYDCYNAMFRDCTSLTTAPALPATTLDSSCYMYMFSGCTALTTAPELPATTLVDRCYYSMFENCTNLNYIKCLATNISATYCTYSWVSGVASTGTFIKSESMSGWTTGRSGIPSNWVVRDPGGIILTQALNVATIEVTGLDSGTSYYTINGGSRISLSEGTTTIPITQGMNGQTLLAYGEFDGEPIQETLTLSWTDYSPSVTITETSNYVTINAPNADVIQYRLGSSGSFTLYTEPVHINTNTTIYVQATKTVSGITYTTEKSQEVTHEVIPPTNLVISCTNNFVTIAATDADTLEYNTDGSSTYTTYTQPFYINQTTTVYAKATNSDGSITASQQCAYVDYAPPVSISESNNYVTITSTTADSITYRLGSSGEYNTYTDPVYIAADTTIYVIATRTVSGVVYTTNASEEVTHELIPPTNLVISCASNTVTITATNATTIEYNFDGSSTYTTYTEPFAITQTVTVYAKATNSDGSITGSQECVYGSASLPTDMVFHLDAINNSGRTGTWYDEVNNTPVTIASGCDVSTSGKSVSNTGGMYAANYNPFSTGSATYSGDFTMSWVGNVTMLDSTGTDAAVFLAGTKPKSGGTLGTGRWWFGFKDNGTYQLMFYCNDGTGTFADSTYRVSTGKNIFTVIRKNSTLYFYVNKTQVGNTVSCPRKLGNTSNAQLNINDYSYTTRQYVPRGAEFYSTFICKRAISDGELSSAVDFWTARYLS